MNNIINTKVKFVRNLHGVGFNTNTTPQTQSQNLKLAIDACSDCGLKAEKLDNLNDNVIENLLASGKLEKKFVKNISHKGYASNEDASVQINGINHIEIFATDLEILDAYSKAKQVDKMLCNKLHFSYSDKYGFLTPEVNNIGSGMTISTLVMLPALNKVNAIKDLPKFSEKLKFTLQPIDTNSGIYLITSGASLGYSEKQICTLTKNYIDNVLKCENEMCKTLCCDKVEIEDKFLRAKAIINSCIKISLEELYVLIGDILIAINAGLVKDVPDTNLQKLFKATQDEKANNTQHLAKIIKNILK